MADLTQKHIDLIGNSMPWTQRDAWAALLGEIEGRLDAVEGGAIDDGDVTAAASDAHDARIARFSASESVASATTSRG